MKKSSLQWRIAPCTVHVHCTCTCVRVYMYMYVYTCTCTLYMYMCTCIHVHVHVVYMYMYIVHVHVYVYIVHVHVHCTCTCTCTCVRVYMYVYTCTCTHVYSNNLGEGLWWQYTSTVKVFKNVHVLPLNYFPFLWDVQTSISKYERILLISTQLIFAVSNTYKYFNKLYTLYMYMYLSHLTITTVSV